MTLDKKEPKIRKVYKPSDKEYKAIRYVYQRKQQMSDKRADFEKDWDKWEKQWDSYRLPKDADDWRSNIYIPITASIIEAQLAELVNQELVPWAVARGPEDEPKATVMNAILEYTWDVSKSNLALFDIIKDALIYGTGIGMEYYYRQPTRIRDEKNKFKEVLEYDDCYLEPVSPYDFYIDEKARSFSGVYRAQDCIRRYIMDYDDFRNFFQGKTWDPMNNASLVKPGGDTNYYEFYRPPERLEHDREVEVLWYWSKREDMLAIVANDVMVKMGPNPYRHKQLPFVKAIDVKRPRQFYGKGEAELLESLQEEVNTLRRMIIDRNHLDIDKPVFVSDTLTLDDEDTIARPHGAIPVGDTDKIKFPEYSDIPRSVFMTLEMLNDDKIRITGMDERQQSVSAAGTATEAAILKEATLKRINMKIWNIKNDTLIDIGRLRAANIMQYYKIPKLREIIGEKRIAMAEKRGLLVRKGGKAFEKRYRTIRLKDKALRYVPSQGQVVEEPARGYTFFEVEPEFFLPTHGGFDIRYKASSSMPISKPLEQQKADELYDRLVTNPTVDPWKLAEYLLKTREVNPDEFKYKPPEQQPSPKENLIEMVELAGIENEEMMRGNEIAPTPYATVAHTEIHIEFMKSNRFKEEADKNVVKNFATHVIGETAAIQAREQGGMPGAMAGEAGGEGVVPGMPSGQMPTVQGLQMPNVVPGRIQGGGEVPSGMPGARSGVQVGRKV